MELIQATCEQVPPWLDLWLKRKKSLVVITGPVLANNWNWQSMKVNSNNWCQLTDIEKWWQIMKKKIFKLLMWLIFIDFFYYHDTSFHWLFSSCIKFVLQQFNLQNYECMDCWTLSLVCMSSQDTCAVESR